MIRRLPSALLAALLLLPACRDASGRHLPPAKMEAVLLDVHLAEAWNAAAERDSTGQPRPRRYDSLAVYYNGIYRHHGISAEEFRSSMDWYRAHPDELDTIYTHLNARLGEMEAKTMR